MGEFKNQDWLEKNGQNQMSNKIEIGNLQSLAVEDALAVRQWLLCGESSSFVLDYNTIVIDVPHDKPCLPMTRV